LIEVLILEALFYYFNMCSILSLKNLSEKGACFDKKLGKTVRLHRSGNAEAFKVQNRED
jgi:hypothetical protein